MNANIMRGLRRLSRSLRVPSWTVVGIAGLLAMFSMGEAHAGSINNMGYVSYDVTTPGASAEFDIVNLTGANSIALADPSFPVVTAVPLSDLSLTVGFSDGSSTTFGASYFTLASDGLSFNGTSIPIGGLNPAPTSATLSGIFDTTSLALSDGSTTTIDPAFSLSIMPSVGSLLSDGDYGLIESTKASIGPSVPEPGSLGLALVGMAVLGFFLLRRRRSRSLMVTATLIAGASALGFGLQPASAAVRLSTLTSPSSGVAGVTTVNLTASGLPFGVSPSQITVTIAPTCAAGATGPVAGEISTTASSLRSILTLSRIGFLIPAGAAQQTYFASVSGSTSGGAGFESTDCAIVAVSHSSTALNACVPTSSLAVATGTNVVAYVPNGAWDTGSTGIQAVTIEGSAAPVSIPTPVSVNSCAANPATGEAVCTGNNLDVFVIDGATKTITAALTSGATGYASFSGGICENCGVAINALTNNAYITVGLSGAPSGSGIQTLSLATDSFSAPFPATNVVSEDISVDPTRNLILSPGETNDYDLFELSESGAIVQEYGDQTTSVGSFDSAAEDCSTGIALASEEFSSNVYLTDLSQAVYTQPPAPGSIGSWSAASQSETLAASFSAGTSGISVASGSSHLGVVTGEFGGNTLAVLQLPSSSGSGVPAISDYAVATLPPTPDGSAFSMGYDPHTITAYTSPNNGKAYAVVADWAPGYPSYLAVVDLQALLNAPRDSGTHDVSSSFGLLANGVVRYVATR